MGCLTIVSLNIRDSFKWPGLAPLKPCESRGANDGSHEFFVLRTNSVAVLSLSTVRTV